MLAGIAGPPLQKHDGQTEEKECPGGTAETEAEPEPDDLYIPESCMELPAAGTLADARNRGIGLALTNAGFAFAKEAGYQYVLADWRTTNLQSSRFWPRRGFRPVVYRLFRRVDERIAWANRVG